MGSQIITKESKLKILFNDQIICFNVTKTTLPQKDYQAIFTLDHLYKVNKYFKAKNIKY